MSIEKKFTLSVILAQVVAFMAGMPLLIYFDRPGGALYSVAVLLTTLTLTGLTMLALWKLLVGHRLQCLAGKMNGIGEGVCLAGSDRKRTTELAGLEDSINRLVEVIKAKEGEKQKLAEQLSETEAAAARGKERFRIMIETVPECVVLAAADGAIKEINKTGLTMVEADFLDQVRGRSIMEFIVPEQRSAVKSRCWNAAVNGGPNTIEFEMQGIKGARSWRECRTALQRNERDEVQSVLVIIRDISICKKMEESLQETNEALKVLIKATPLAVVSYDSDGLVGMWNPAAERIFGWNENEVQGRFNPIVQPEKKKEFMTLLSRVIKGESLENVEMRRQKKDGSLITVRASSAPMRNSKSEISGIITIIDDISERKRAEAEIRRQYDTQTAINWILHISLENMPLKNIMKQTLDLILSIPWLSFESRGAIFLVDQEPEMLVMKAERGLSPQIKKKCEKIPFGKCFCGKAASSGEVTFSGCLEKRHELTYEDMRAHGHYCVPIKLGRTVLGVINIYLKEGHVREDKEVEFLNAIGNALAGVIRRSRAEAALQESEKRYRTLAEAAHDMIFIVDREGRIDYMNSRGADMFHRSTQELTGKSLIEFLSPESAERQRAIFANVFESGESIYVENAFSSEIWLGTWLVPLKDKEGRVGSVLGVARCITERIRFEQERDALIHDLQNAFNMISRSQKEWRDTFDSITDMIAIIDNNFTILKANIAFARYFGRHPRDIVNARCSEFCHAANGPMTDCPHQKTLAEKQACSGEVADKRTNRVIRITTFPYLAPGGNCLGSIHVSRDVTDEKEREMRLLMSERLAALGQMASGIAHEINNPLASIAGCSEGLLARIQKGQYDFKLFETYLNIIQEEIFRCKGITTAMLSFVRKKTYEKKEVNLSEMLDRTVEIISFQGRMKEVTIIRNYRAQMQTVQANEGELRQVFLAVMVNALDAMEDKGTLRLETDVSGTEAFARICDSGPGITPDEMAKVFDPFFTTKVDKGGTGLGLSIARKIVHNHNGVIEADSEQGKGSVFTIKLPI